MSRNRTISYYFSLLKFTCRVFKWPVVFGGVVAVLFPSVLFSAALQLRPTVSMETRYHDNIDMDSGAGESGIETVLKGVLSFSRFTETTGLTGRIHGNASTSTRSQQYLTASSYKKWELSKLNIDGLYRRDTTVREIDSFQDPSDLDALAVSGSDVDEGLTQVELIRKTLRVAPKWEYQFSERTALDFVFGYSNVSYDNNEAISGLNDYDQHGVTTSVVHKLSERDTFTTTVGYSRYSSDMSSTEGRSTEFAVGYDRGLSEVYESGFSFGVRRSNLETDSFNESGLGLLMRLHMQYKLKLGKIGASAQRSVVPSGSGNLVELSQLSLNASHQLRERLRAVIKIRGSENNPINRPTADKRYRLKLSTRLGWRLTRWWVVSTGYVYQRREQLNSTNDADDNIVFLHLRYSKAMTIF